MVIGCFPDGSIPICQNCGRQRRQARTCSRVAGAAAGRLLCGCASRRAPARTAQAPYRQEQAFRGGCLVSGDIVTDSNAYIWRRGGVFGERLSTDRLTDCPTYRIVHCYQNTLLYASCLMHRLFLQLLFLVRTGDWSCVGCRRVLIVRVARRFGRDHQPKSSVRRPCGDAQRVLCPWPVPFGAVQPLKADQRLVLLSDGYVRGLTASLWRRYAARGSRSGPTLYVRRTLCSWRQFNGRSLAAKKASDLPLCAAVYGVRQWVVRADGVCWSFVADGAGPGKYFFS